MSYTARVHVYVCRRVNVFDGAREVSCSDLAVLRAIKYRN